MGFLVIASSWGLAWYLDSLGVTGPYGWLLGACGILLALKVDKVW